TPTFFWAPMGLDPSSTPANKPTLPNNPVTDLDINTETGILSASLNGRGVWQFQIRTLIQGHVFEDFNGNGAFDAGEQSLQDWVVALRDINSNPIVATTASDATG